MGSQPQSHDDAISLELSTTLESFYQQQQQQKQLLQQQQQQRIMHENESCYDEDLNETNRI